MSSTATRTPPLRASLWIAPFLTALLVLGATTRDAWSQFGNPPMCSNPTVNIEIEEFRDLNGNGMLEVGEPQIFPFTQKAAGDKILYRARLSHTGASRCGFQAGRVCIDLPQVGCNGGPTFAPPSFTTVAAGECCAVDIGNPVPLVCDPLTCNPPGISEYISNVIPYTVNPADDVNNKGLCPGGTLRANAFYDDGFSKQGAEPGIKPANASIPICNPVEVEAAHFMCYEFRKVNFNTTVQLLDRFRNVSATVREGKRICTGADKNDEDPNIPPFPSEHLVEYEIATPSSPQAKVQVSNQFGVKTYTISRATRLMVPSSKTLAPAGQPAPLPPNSIDHFECYQASGTAVNQTVAIEDQFGQLLVNVRQPDFVCVPANKNNGGFATAAGAQASGLVCYDINTTPDRQTFVGLFNYTNQFETRGGVQIHGPREFCLQSSITVVP